MALGLVACHGEEHVTGIFVQFLARKQEKKKKRYEEKGKEGGREGDGM